MSPKTPLPDKKGNSTPPKASSTKTQSKKSKTAPLNFDLPTDHLGPLLETLLERIPPERRTFEVLTAMGLYYHGFNVAPMPYCLKAGWPWRVLQYTRLHPLFIPVLFDQVCNFAIIMGRTSQNLFTIDCETNEAYEEQGYLLRIHSLPIYSVRTHGVRDGGHYYFRALGGEVENIRSGLIQGLEIRGSRCYVIAPPSVHPITGRTYEWAERETPDPPAIDIRQLHWLPLNLINKQTPKKDSLPPLYGIDEELSKLSRNTLEFIYSGAVRGTRNNRLFTALCDMIGNEIDDQSIESLLVDAAESSGLDPKEIYATFKSAYSRDREPARPPKPSPTPQSWEKALKWAYQHQWEGRNGQSDRAVFLAMCERARTHSSERGTFRASVREIAELAQISRATAGKSIHRLLNAGYIMGAGYDIHSAARLFCFATFSNPFEGDSLHEWATISIWSIQQWPTYETNPPKLNTNRNDAFERNALGKTATLVWQNMLQAHRTLKPKMIAQICNLKLHQVYHALKKLDQYKLVVRRKSGWSAVLVNDEWLEENVAAAAGTLGRMKARRAKHEIERALKAGWDIIETRDKYERQYYTELGNSILKPQKNL